MNAMMITMMKSSTETADPRPEVQLADQLVVAEHATASSVLFAPRVWMKTVSKMRTASSVRNSTATRIAARMLGRITRHSRCQALAPSTLAAST